MNLLDKFHFKDKNGIVTTMEICDSFSRNKITEVIGMIPTKVSQLVNDTGYALKSYVDQVAGLIPTKTSELQNDSGFITSSDIPTNVSSFVNDAGYVNSNSIPIFNTEGNFSKIKLNPNSNISITYGASWSNYDLNIPYATGYLADFAIAIPENCRPVTGWAAINAHAIKAGAIVSAHVTGYANGIVSGYLFSPSSGVNGNVGISIEMFGY